MSARHHDRVVLYTDEQGESRWRLVAAGNSRVLSNGGQGFTSNRSLFANITRSTGRRWFRYDTDGDDIEGFVLLIDERTFPPLGDAL